MVAIRRCALVVALAVACVGFVLPAIAAYAQDYDLTFTLPTAGKSGCMVCHADPNIGRLEGSQWVSYYVDGSALDAGPHAAVLCTGCHLDFAYKAPHETAGDWVTTARLACKNCHAEQWEAYSQGVHSIAVQPGKELTAEDEAKPLCGDCHWPSHDMMYLANGGDGREVLHSRGYEVCGSCHEGYWDSYSDYYHGAAYKQGALDAPACWQCHGWHDILPSSDRRSRVSSDNLKSVCGECHSESTDKFAASYQELVHRRAEAYEANPVYEFMKGTQETIRGLWSTVRSWFS
ncbi:MAG: hypothetical protein OEV43_05185 [Coriobacteriia bacterium]|nr:hypothetical protein [Coriobacteriia bacterium]